MNTTPWIRKKDPKEDNLQPDNHNQIGTTIRHNRIGTANYQHYNQTGTSMDFPTLQLDRHSHGLIAQPDRHSNWFRKSKWKLSSRPIDITG